MTEIQKLQAEVEALKSKVATLERAQVGRVEENVLIRKLQGGALDEVETVASARAKACTSRT